MNRRTRRALTLAGILTASLVAACRSTYVVVPRPNGGYRAIDTLRATRDGNNYRVVFRFDTVTHTRTLYRTDTLYKDGVKIDTLRRVDTVRIIRRDTIRVIRRDTVRRVDTVRTGPGMVGFRVDTVRIAGPGMVGFRTDTVRVVVRDTVRIVHQDTIRVPIVLSSVSRVDTVRILVGGARVDTVRVVQRDTIRIATRDTVRVTVRDTVRITVRDTVRIAADGKVAKRTLKNLPPGQYPPPGMCRVWVEGVPPGRQRNATACDALADIPAGAFVLFNGQAYDFDYDWLSEEGTGQVPPQIISVARKKKGG